MMYAEITEPSLLPLPQTAEYALRAVLHIAARRPVPVRVSELAEAIGAPANYLSKTLHQLARAGVLASVRGPAGGFRLAVPAERLTLERIVGVFTPATKARCLLGTGTCGDVQACAVHTRWKPVREELRAFFDDTTVADLVAATASTSRTSLTPTHSPPTPRSTPRTTSPRRGTT